MTTTTSFAPSSRSLSGEDITVSLAALGSARSIPTPDTTTTTTTVIPLSISSPIPTSTSPQSPTEYFTGGASTPLLAGLISIGAFAFAAILICTWHRFVGPGNTGFVLGQFADWITPARFRRRGLEEEGEAGEVGGQGGAGPEGIVQRRRGRSRRSRNDLGRARPQMFDAWIDTVDDTFKWEASGSVPLSARLSLSGPVGGMAEVSSRAARDSVLDEEKDEEKYRRSMSVQMRESVASGSVASGSGTLQVAVLLQMPSPPPPPQTSHTVTEIRNDINARGELVVGVVEAPWTREPPSSQEGEETTTS